MVATSAPNDCPPNWEYIQGGVPTGGPSYDVPAPGGVITSWKTEGGANAGAGMSLKVYSPTAASDTWTVVAHTPLKRLTPNTLNTVPARVSVQGGDRIGLRVSSDDGGPCWFPGAANLGTDYHALGFNPLSPTSSDPPVGSEVTFNNDDKHALVNIAAVVEPDADGDGFGDETQDKCVGVSGTDNGCPVPPVVVPPPPEPLLPLSVNARASRVQHVLRQHGIVLVVQPSLASKVSATATVSIPAAGKVLRFTRATKNVAANSRATLKLRLSKSRLGRVKRALRSHRKLFARAVVTTTASGNNPAVKRFKIRLKP